MSVNINNKDNKAQLEYDKKFKRALNYNILGVVLPFILSLIPIALLFDFSSILTFIYQGNFLLFSASFYTSAIYLLNENKNQIEDKVDVLFELYSVWLLIISSSTYAILYFSQLAEVKNDKYCFGFYFVIALSLILLGIAIYALYRSLLLEFLRYKPEVNVEKMSQEGVAEIMDNL